MTTCTQALWAALDEPRRAKDLIRAVHYAPSVVYRALHQMALRGEAERISFGYYRRTENRPRDKRKSRQQRLEAALTEWRAEVSKIHPSALSRAELELLEAVHGM